MKRRVLNPDLVPDYRRRRLGDRNARALAERKSAELQERLGKSKHLPYLADGELCLRSLHTFVRKAWHVLEPRKPFIDNWHIKVICEHVEAMFAPVPDIRFLVINVPPGSMKSLLINVFAPAWAWARWPERRMAFAAGSDGLETRDSLKCRNLITSPWYQLRFGHIYQLAGDQNAKNRFVNDKTGVRHAQTFMSAVLGERFDHWFFDDPHKTEMMESPEVRASKVTKYREEYSTRLSDVRTGTQCLIMQRIAEDDLSGYILAEGLADAHIMIPMRYETENADRKVYVKPRFKDPRTKDGELLDPVRFPEAETTKLEKTLGSYGKAGQFQQIPSPRGGGIFKRGDWQFYKVLPELDEVIGSWDMKFKEVATSSWVAGQAWGRKGAQKFLLPGRIREHLGFGASLMGVKAQRAALVEKFGSKVVATLIEDKANGPAIIESARSEVSGLIAVEPQGGKEARAFAIQPQHEAHNLFLPDPSIDPTIEEFIRRCSIFPAGDGGDEVDAMTQAITWLSLREGFGLYNLMSTEAAEAARKAEEEAKRRAAEHRPPPLPGTPPANGMFEYMRFMRG